MPNTNKNFKVTLVVLTIFVCIIMAAFYKKALNGELPKGTPTDSNNKGLTTRSRPDLAGTKTLKSTVEHNTITEKEEQEISSLLSESESTVSYTLRNYGVLKL